MKRSGKNQRRVDAGSTNLAGVKPSDEITFKTVSTCWIAALVPLALGFLMYFMGASDAEKLRLINPVATVGEFVNAECATYGGKARPRSSS